MDQLEADKVQIDRLAAWVKNVQESEPNEYLDGVNREFYEACAVLLRELDRKDSRIKCLEAALEQVLVTADDFDEDYGSLDYDDCVSSEYGDDLRDIAYMAGVGDKKARLDRIDDYRKKARENREPLDYSKWGDRAYANELHAEALETAVRYELIADAIQDTL